MVEADSQSPQHTATGTLQELETGCLWAGNRLTCAWATCLRALEEQPGTSAGERKQAVEQIRLAAAPVFATPLVRMAPAAALSRRLTQTGSSPSQGTQPQTATMKLRASGWTAVRLAGALHRRRPGLDTGGVC